MFVALRDLRFAKGRFALVGLVIGLVALMATLLTGLANGLVDDGISGLRRLPMTDLAFQNGAESTFSRSTLTPKDLDRFKGAEDVEATPIGVSFVNARRANGATIDIALFGVAPGSFLAPEGEARDSLKGPPGVILSHELEADGLKVGDELTIAGVDQKLPVLGFTFSGTYGHVDIAFSSLETWQDLYYGSSAKGRFSAIAIDNDGADLAKLAGSDLDVVTKVQAYAGSPGYSGETQTMTLIRGFLLAISALIVGAFFTVWTVQRAGEIGILKALGASSAYVIRDAVGQMAVILVASTFVGAALAIGIGQLVGGAVPFRLSAGPILTSVGLLILLGLIGCLIAVRRITSVDPIIALRARN